MLDFSAILSGVGSLFDFGVDPRQNIPTHTDAEAIRKDWEAVGADMRWAMESVVLNG